MVKLTKSLGTSTAKEVTQLAGAASGWGSGQLKQWGLMEGDLDNEKKGFNLLKRGKGKGAADKKKKKKRPLGVSIDLGGMFGQTGRSLYSPPAAGRTRKPGYRGDPLIPVRGRVGMMMVMVVMMMMMMIVILVVVWIVWMVIVIVAVVVVVV